MEQLTIYDELSRQSEETAARAAEERGPLAAYSHRHGLGQLIPGESCPACGHVFPGRYDATRNHALVSDGVCVGMDLTRRHLALDLQVGADPADRAARAVHAGWPQGTVDAWIAAPDALVGEVL